MLFNVFLIFVVLFCGVYFAFRAYQNTRLYLNENPPEDQDYLVRKEIELLIEREFEVRANQLRNELKKQVIYEDDDDYEKRFNSNTLPTLKVVK